MSENFALQTKVPEQESGADFGLIYEWHAEERKLWLLRLYTHQQMDDITDKEIKKARQGAGIT